jgi:hypothetical protein
MKAILASIVQLLVLCNLSLHSFAQATGGTPQSFIPPQKVLQNIVRKLSRCFYKELEETGNRLH